MITIMQVSAGVSLVEIGESGLRILCGCPENVYKLLKIAGAISWTGAGGKSWETGPNAILLSELPVQGGHFSNLIEFPVLQMLYRQGMLIPGHPNNSGQRPLIIGLKQDLESMARYVHLGNYGMVEATALEGSGLSATLAHELLRMKLKFAFGSFRCSESLLEFCAVEGPATELRGGSFLRRLGPNRYQFFHGDEVAEIDLNLKPTERYARPYELPSRAISRPLFSVVHLGEGDGWDIARPCMSSLVVHRGEAWLIDAGPHVRESLEAVGLGVNDLRGVFLTHAHDDHVVGLTALLHAERRIAFAAVPYIRATVEAKLQALAGLDGTAFRETFEVRDLSEGRWNDLGGLEVWPFLSPHPVETTCLRFRVSGHSGMRSYAHLADLSSFAVIESMVTVDASAPGISRETADRAKAAYLEAADVKKVDVGGGMIHGDASDFRKDTSGLLLLSHTSDSSGCRDLDYGRVVDFGDETVLLPSEADYRMDAARGFLACQFPDIPAADFEPLLEAGWLARERGALLAPPGSRLSTVELLLSGVVEQRGSDGSLAELAAGALVGEAESLDANAEAPRYRCVTAIESVPIPVSRYVALIDKNDLGADRARRFSVGAFLRSCPSFAGLSSLAIEGLASSSVLVSYEAGERLGGPGTSIHALVSGSIGLLAAGHRVLGIRPGEVFGEECLLSPGAPFFDLAVEEDSTALLFGTEVLSTMPIILWKLREILARRLSSAHSGFAFVWQDDYSVGVAELDFQHRQLFALLQGLSQQLAADGSCPDAGGLVSEIRAFAFLHFQTEEGFMEAAGYSELAVHRDRHRAIIVDLDHRAEALDCDKAESVRDFCDFLMDWILRHTLSYDRAYVGRLAPLV
ncbi:MAG: hemerythrin domain-containing protein [Spirochaetota bacterium]